MAIDKEAIKEHIRGILVALGDDPNREGLKETPDRVAKMYEEVFEGMNYSNHEIAQMFSKTFEDDLSVKDHKDMVIVKDIDIFSYCEHHMALMYDMKVSVAYLPKDKVLGLSKIARICDMVGKRLQLQERIGSDIAEIIMEVSGSEDVAVYIEGCHSCMSARGIKKHNAKTVTTTLRGAFDTAFDTEERRKWQKTKQGRCCIQRSTTWAKKTLNGKWQENKKRREAKWQNQTRPLLYSAVDKTAQHAFSGQRRNMMK